eukprot:3515831-Pyramimonas_sp.AAC.1
MGLPVRAGHFKLKLLWEAPGRLQGAWGGPARGPGCPTRGSSPREAPGGLGRPFGAPGSPPVPRLIPIQIRSHSKFVAIPYP